MLLSQVSEARNFEISFKRNFMFRMNYRVSYDMKLLTKFESYSISKIAWYIKNKKIKNKNSDLIVGLWQSQCVRSPRRVRARE